MSLAAASAFAMHTGEINVNDKDLELSAKIDMGQFQDGVEPGSMFVGGRFLNADKRNSSDHLGSLGAYYEVDFLMMREIGNKGMRMGMGAKVNHTQNYTTIPLGLEFAYKIPADGLIPMRLSGSLYYAPSVLSFSSAKDFVEYRIGYEVEVIQDGHVVLGYRNIDTNYDSAVGNFNYNSSFYLGFKIVF